METLLQFGTICPAKNIHVAGTICLLGHFILLGPFVLMRLLVLLKFSPCWVVRHTACSSCCDYLCCWDHYSCVDHFILLKPLLLLGETILSFTVEWTRLMKEQKRLVVLNISCKEKSYITLHQRFKVEEDLNPRFYGNPFQDNQLRDSHYTINLYKYMIKFQYMI